jgi:hypothetical protein
MATPKTPASASSSYLSPAEFLARTDWRTIGQLCSDAEGVSVPFANLATDANLNAALDDASGDLEAACFMGQKYRTEDLAMLKTTACVARARMYRIIRDRALAYLLERRPDFSAQLPQGVEKSMDRSEAWLEQLAQGVRIFGFLETMDAGRIDQNILTNDEITQRNLLVVQAERYFGIRGDRSLPGGSTGITG